MRTLTYVWDCVTRPLYVRIWSWFVSGAKKIGLASWGKLGLAIAVEKYLSFFFYYGAFPIWMHRRGLQGVCELFAFQFVVSSILLLIYDALGKDIFGIVGVKEKIGRLMAWLRMRFGWVNFTRRSPPKWAIEFFIAYWQFFPALGQLIVRPHGKRGTLIQEIRWLLIGCTISTTFWTTVWSIPRLVKWFMS